ncbi:Heparan-alpha-glucosaminide N-acetyltransferase [Trichoplax sp. H2]|nr:Heparan-alpha-glucosaminide N-acetyltransferase [Trichoplax sp. H2]|eukprot:RDD40051.1 Heparan-alpha-glucosaminide N-acetyltransferase [Trichoplax sp. H2]
MLKTDVVFFILHCILSCYCQQLLHPQNSNVDDNVKCTSPDINIEIGNYLYPQIGFNTSFQSNHCFKKGHVNPGDGVDDWIIPGDMVWNVTINLENGASTGIIGLSFRTKSLILVYGDADNPQIAIFTTDLWSMMNSFPFQSRFGMSYNDSIDFAHVSLHSTLPSKVALYGKSAECYNCKEENIANLQYKHNTTVYIDTNFPYLITAINTTDKSVICSKQFQYVKNGLYVMVIFQNGSNGNSSCNIYSIHDSYYSQLPIIIGAVILAVALLLWQLIYYLYRNRSCSAYHSTESLITEDLGNINDIDRRLARVSEESIHPLAQRIYAVDAFRGLCITIMIFVNSGGGGYWYFRSTPWNGLTFADLILPWFIFIVGICIALSFYNHRYITASRLPPSSAVLKVLSRSVILFLIGLFLNDGVNLSTWRIPGNLQKVAISYIVVSLSVLYLAKPPDTITNLRAIREIVCIWKIWIGMIGLLSIYLSLIFALPVPGCPTGYFGPGGLSDDANHYNCTGGATGYIDRFIFGNHLDANPSCKVLYRTHMPFDSEGCLSTLTSILTCFMGLQAGLIITTYNKGHKERFKRWLFWGVLWVATGVALCGGKQNMGFIPLNRNLWSLSYITLLSGLAYFVLMMLYLLIDVMSWWHGNPIIYGGFNSIVLYCGHIVLRNYFPFYWLTNNTHSEQLFRDLMATSLWLLIAFYLYYKRVFVTIH